MDEKRNLYIRLRRWEGEPGKREKEIIIVKCGNIGLVYQLALGTESASKKLIASHMLCLSI